MNSDLKQNLTNADTWIRGLFLLLFVIIFALTRFVIGVVVLFQFVYCLVTGSTNTRLMTFGKSLSIYVNQIVSYLTYNTEIKPYPFNDWPKENS